MTNTESQVSEEKRQKVSLLLDVIKRYDTYIISTNAKASLIIAFNSLVLGIVLLKFGDIIGFYSTPNSKTFAGFVLLIITASTLLSLFYVFQVVYPFFGTTTDNKKQKSSLIYFGSVSNMSADEYIEKISNSSLTQLIEDLATQATILAGGLQEKMLKMRYSIKAISLTMLLILLLALFRAAGNFT
jgi:hypothetical protein